MSNNQAELGLIPRKVLFGNPQKVLPKISPDGKLLAYLAPAQNILNVWVKTIGGEDERLITRDYDRGIVLYLWAYDSKRILYLQDKDGNENWNIFKAEIETDEISNLTPFESVTVGVIAHDKHFPDEILIAMNKEDPKLHDAYRLNINSGDIDLVAKNPGNFIRWMADTHLKIRCAVAARSDGGFDLMIRENEDARWHRLVAWEPEDSLSSSPLGFSRDGKYLHLLESRNANTVRLTRVKIADGSIEVLTEDSQYDIDDVLTDPDSYDVQAVCFIKARKEWVALNETVKRDFDAIRQTDSGDFEIHNRDASDNRWVVGFTKDNGPNAFYVYNRETRYGAFLFHSRPELNDYALAPMQPISFSARDGLVIHGYLTLPPGGEKKLPLVLNVHGGPWFRNTWGYDPEAQWLANRGYACLQVNFRGSTGYGKNFIKAGDKEWGGKMYDDLVDAFYWAIEQEIANPERVAIYGMSYGGYAALIGATFTPDLFRCAIDIVGPSNLVTWLTTRPPYWDRYLPLLHKRVGDPDTEEDFLRSRSPLFKADQIKIPLLIAQGANDPRVSSSESEQIVEVMKRKGIDYIYMLFPDEGHGLLKHENRLRFYATAEQFLANHLGGRCETQAHS
jgi:dipeptidyl aminopeptidase/acylaminoacyl peptidase